MNGPRLLLNQGQYSTLPMSDGNALVDYPLVVMVPPMPGFDPPTIGRMLQARAEQGGDTIIVVPYGSPEHAHDFFKSLGFRSFAGNFNDHWVNGWTVHLAVAGKSEPVTRLVNQYRPREYWPKELPGDSLAWVVTSDDGYDGALASEMEYRKARLFFLVLDTTAEDVADTIIELYHSTLSRPDVPDFGTEGLVTGEADLLDAIATYVKDLQDARDSLAETAGWRRLLGKNAGHGYRDEVVQALDFILSDHGWKSDPEFVDVKREDFILDSTRPERRARIVGNAKSVNTGVKKSHISQGHSHRQMVEEQAQAVGDTETAFPALLVINQFRGSDSLAERRQDVGQPTLDEAQRNRVALLRSWDLFQMVNRQLASQALPTELVDRWLAEGGWLRVELDSAELVPEAGRQ